MKLIAAHRKLRAWGIFPDLQKEGPPPHKSSDLNENQSMRFRMSKNPTVEVSISYIQSCEIFYFFFVFAGSKITHTFFSLFFFSGGWLYRTSDPRRWEEDSFDRKLKVLVLFINDKNIGVQLSSLPPPFFIPNCSIKILKQPFSSA